MEASGMRDLAVTSVTKEIKEINDAIQAEAKKGRLSVMLVSITPAAAQYFKSAGYSVNVITMENYSMITIMW